jgi:cyclophilin family peptidyl-prolyl cis-trans isomerase
MALTELDYRGEESYDDQQSAMRRRCFLVLIGILALTSLMSMSCDSSASRTAVLETSMGTIKFQLYEIGAPITAANFIKLTESGFYDNLIFHRVIDDFVIQTGDPTGTGMGGAGETIRLETSESMTHIDGAVGMARGADPNSASSQFYICDGPQVGLDGRYAVFGRVTEGMEVVRAIAAVATDASDKPLVDVVLTRVTIEPS